jgi:hypothetical protein
MFHEVILSRIIQDNKGFDKSVTEKYFTENKEFLAESEQALMQYWNGECEVTMVKQSNLREFVNERDNDDQSIYIVTLEAIFINEVTGEETATKYNVGLFATSIPEATNIALEYCAQGLEDLSIVSVKRTKWIDVIK